jgi:hypothetical protein
MSSAALPDAAAAPVRRRKRAAAVAELPAEIPRTRLEELRDQLPGTVDCLKRRRADLIDAALIEEYVALQWLEWQGGGLRLTVTGRNVCAQIATRGR